MESLSLERHEEGKVLVKLMEAVYKANGVSDKCFMLRYSGHVEVIDFHVAVSKEEFNNNLITESIYRADSHEERWNKLNKWLLLVNKYIEEEKEVNDHE